MRTFSSILTLTAMLGIVAVLGAFTQDDARKVKVGEMVPAFTLTDTNGKKHDLADLKGKMVVLEWFNPDCPYVRNAYDKGVIAHTRRTIKAKGDEYVYLVVNSSAHLERDEIIQASESFKKERKLDHPILVDYDGKVGKMLDARTTPHMFIIDAKGVLRYSGALTDDPLFNKGDEAKNYVLNALDQIAAGEAVSPDTTRPWGCGIKYAGE